MVEPNSREYFSQQMRAKFEERNKQLAALEGQGSSKDVLEKKREEIMQNFYNELEKIKKQPGYEEAQKKHNEEIRAKIAEMIKPEDQKLLEELKNAGDVEKRVQLFVTLTDKIPLDALAGIIPYYGDIGMSVFSAVFLIYQGRKIGLSGKEIGKIVGFQVIDAVIGMIGFTDVVGDILDYFFKANKYSAKYFTEKVQELEQKAKEKGIDPKKIEEVKQEVEREGRKSSILSSIIDGLKKGGTSGKASDVGHEPEGKGKNNSIFGDFVNTIKKGINS